VFPSLRFFPVSLSLSLSLISFFSNRCDDARSTAWPWRPWRRRRVRPGRGRAGRRRLR
jgi:hypothetical protein